MSQERGLGTGKGGRRVHEVREVCLVKWREFRVMGNIHRLVCYQMKRFYIAQVAMAVDGRCCYTNQVDPDNSAFRHLRIHFQGCDLASSSSWVLSLPPLPL